MKNCFNLIDSKPADLRMPIYTVFRKKVKHVKRVSTQQFVLSMKEVCQTKNKGTSLSPKFLLLLK